MDVKTTGYMKRYIVIMAALCLTALVGCDKDTSEWAKVDKNIVGEWALENWDGEKTDDFNVYMKLNGNGHFEIYQQVTTAYYELYTGVYRADKGVLSGEYSDGVLWNDSYDYSLSNDGNRLTLVTQSGSHIRSVYVRSKVPSDIVVDNSSRSAASSVRRAL